VLTLKSISFKQKAPSSSSSEGTRIKLLGFMSLGEIRKKNLTCDRFISLNADILQLTEAGRKSLKLIPLS